MNRTVRSILLPGILFAALACSGNTPSGPHDPGTGPEDPGPLEGPVVSRVEPTILLRGETFDLHVFGSGYDRRSKVQVTKNGAPSSSIATNSTTYVSAHELVASITTAADAPSGPYEVVVTNGQSKQGVGTELVDLVPVINDIEPSMVAPLDTVRISGWNFGSEPSRTRVTFDGLQSTVLTVQDRVVVALVPPGVRAGTAVVEVTVATGTARINLDIVLNLSGTYVNVAGPVSDGCELGPSRRFQGDVHVSQVGDEVTMTLVIAGMTFRGVLNDVGVFSARVTDVASVIPITWTLRVQFWKGPGYVGALSANEHLVFPDHDCTSVYPMRGSKTQ
jgi:hypothetical protein